MVSPEEITKNIKPTSPVKDEKDLANQIAANLKNKVGPLVLKSMMALAPLYLQGDLMQQIEQAAQNPGEIAQAAEGLSETGALAGLSSLGQQDAAQQALFAHHQEQGLPKAEADKKAQTDADAVQPPAKEPVKEEEPAYAKASAGEKEAQEAQAAAAGAEGLGMGQEPEKVAPHGQRAAGQRLKQEQAGLPTPQPEEEAPEEEMEPTPEEMMPPPPPPTIPVGAAPQTPKEQEPETVPEEEQRKKALQLDEARQLKEQQEGEGGGLGDKAKQKTAGETIGALGGPETAAAGKAVGQKLGARAGEQAGEAAAGGEEPKKKAEEVVQKALQPALQQVIDIGWAIYGCGWLITWPLLLYLMYLDWTKQGITLPFIGKIKVVKLNIMQKVDAAFQITLAFLSYVIIICIFLIIYEIFSGKMLGIIVTEEINTFLRWLGLA